MLPQAIAIRNIQSGIMAGKLNGVMPAHTPAAAAACGVDAAGDVVGQLAELQVADAGRVLDHLGPRNVALGVGQSLALLGRQHGRERLDVLADELLVLQEDARAGADRRLAPGREGGLGGGDHLRELVGGRQRHAREDLLGRRVDHVAPLGGGGLDEFTVDEQGDAGMLAVMAVSCGCYCTAGRIRSA